MDMIESSSTGNPFLSEDNSAKLEYAKSNFFDSHRDVIYNELYSPVYCASVFSNSVVEFMNPYNKGSEAYFGDNNPLKLNLIYNIGRLREVYKKATNKNEIMKRKKEYLKDFNPIIKDMERLIVSSFNIEKCTIGLFDMLNAFAYPLCWDSNLVKEISKRGKEKYDVNTTFKASLEDIMETKTGFKYKDPKGKIYVLGLGLGFFEYNYTDAEIAGVIMHELGHCMQQAICSINENLASAMISSSIQSLWSFLDPFLTVGTFGLNLLIGIFEGATIDTYKKADPEDLGDEIIKYGIGSQQDEFDRERLGEQIEDQSKKDIKNIPKKEKPNILYKIFISFFGGLFTLLNNIITPLLYLVNIPRHIVLATNLNFLKKNRRFEQFADMFAASYGLGPEQSSALAKLGNISEKVDIGAFQWLNYVPILNVAIAFGQYINTSNNCLIHGYPDMKKRIVGIYNTCKYEIENNKDLTPEQRKELTKQMEDIKKTYDEYVFDFSSKGIVYAIWATITRKNIEKEDTDIRENVLEALKEVKERSSIKEAKEPEKKKTGVSKESIKAAIFNTFKGFKNLNILNGLTNQYKDQIDNI